MALKESWIRIAPVRASLLDINMDTGSDPDWVFTGPLVVTEVMIINTDHHSCISIMGQAIPLGSSPGADISPVLGGRQDIYLSPFFTHLPGTRGRYVFIFCSPPGLETPRDFLLSSLCRF